MKRLVLTAAALAAVALPELASAQTYPGRGGAEQPRSYAQQDRSGVGQVRRGVPNPDRSVTNTERQQSFERQQDAQREADRERDRDARNSQGRVDDRWDNRGQRNDGRYDNGRYDNDRRNDPRYGGAQRWSRNDPNWWRGRPEFRGYAGVRQGFWFAPSYGYIRVEPRWATYRWRRGDVVPFAYRSYEVVDPRFYGLDWPAPGYRWVYLGDDLALIQVVTGRIVDILPGYLY